MTASSDWRRLTRRDLIKTMIATGALTGAGGLAAIGSDALAAAAAPGGKGYGLDPDLIKRYAPGDFWPLTMTAEQRKATQVLCDLILPADGETAPSASALEVDAFIDEWVSAPYPAQIADRKLVLEGLAWLDAEAGKRFGKGFVAAAQDQQTAILDEICYAPNAKAEFKQAAVFFDRFRDLTATGYYTTPEGMKDIGYVGNVPLAAYPGPPAEVLKRLGLA